MKIDLVIDHPLQRKIFERLIYSSSLHFSEIKDKHVESNLLTYHLGKMTKSGLIQKSPKSGYSLTVKGRALADRISLKTMQFRMQPKISTMIMIRATDTGNLLMYRRYHQPFLNQIGFPSGKVHYGEKIFVSVERELEEKTGLKINLNHAGDVYFILHHGTEVLTHFLGHIFYADISTEVPVSQMVDTQGDVFWGNPEKLKAEEFIPGFFDVIKLVDENKNAHFFKELDYEV